MWAHRIRHWANFKPVLMQTSVFVELRYTTPANKIHWTNDRLMLVQRPRRWPIIKPPLSQGIVFAGYCAGHFPVGIYYLSNVSNLISTTRWCSNLTRSSYSCRKSSVISNNKNKFDFYSDKIACVFCREVKGTLHLWY